MYIYIYTHVYQEKRAWKAGAESTGFRSGGSPVLRRMADCLGVISPFGVRARPLRKYGPHS